MKDILLDATVVYIAEAYTTGKIKNASISFLINEIITKADKVYYESKTGQSHLYATIHRHPVLGKKLVALDEDLAPNTYEGEEVLLRSSISAAENSPRIIGAIQEYERLKQGPPRKRSIILGYCFRLLLIARQLNACIWSSEGRMKVLEALFDEANIKREIRKDSLIGESEGCRFPYLPKCDFSDKIFRYQFINNDGISYTFVAQDETIRNLKRKIKIFISYSHHDIKYREQLERHLSILKRQGLVQTWSDRNILPSEDWQNCVDVALEEADIILLLVSADFCASDYCWDIEMQRALEKHKAGSVKVIPLSVRPCSWEGAPFAHIKGLPFDLKPVSEWANTDSAWAHVINEISRLIKSV